LLIGEATGGFGHRLYRRLRRLYFTTSHGLKLRNLTLLSVCRRPVVLLFSSLWLRWLFLCLIFRTKATTHF
jgi:hypothetical protein